MLITLQEGFDALVRSRALERCGRDLAALQHLLGHSGAQLALATPDDTLPPREDEGGRTAASHQQNYENHLAAVRKELDEIREEFWHDVALDLDRANRGEKTLLTFVGGVPSDPREARVTPTSLARLVAGMLGEYPSQDAGTASIEIDPKQMPTREKNLLRMIGLAARHLAANDPKALKPSSELHQSYIAASWLGCFKPDERRTGISDDSIIRAISAGKDELKKV